MTDRESFFERWLRILRQKLAAKSRELDHPAEAMDVLLENQMAAIAQARSDLVVVGAAEKRLQSLVDEYGQRVARYQAEAKAALLAGNRDLARTSLRRSIECERLIKEGRAHLADVSSQRSELSELVEQLRAQYDRLRMRRETVNAMATGARAAVSAQESLTPIGDVGAERERTLEAARETLARLNARATALAELRSAGALDAIGAGEFDSRAISDSEIDNRLEALEALPPPKP
ncbi:MAG TPA: PspA/IM30 family protein [Candidatus Cybelea sp.]|jgi:phage shock protein A